MHDDSSDIKRFLLIDDHTIVRAALKDQCRELYPNAIVVESADGKGIMEILEAHEYSLVITDIHIPNCETISLISRIHVRHPNIPVLVYSMTSPNIYALRVMKAGAMGFVSKEATIEELEKAIELALHGDKHFSQDVINLIANKPSQMADIPFSKLTNRELQIVTLLLSGQKLTDIANHLNLSMSTVGTHKENLFCKLQIKNLLELKQLSDIY